MRTIAVLALACSAVCFAGVPDQKKSDQKTQAVTPSPAFVTIPGKGTERWKSTAMKADVLAKRMAAAVKNLKGVKADLLIDVQTPLGQGRFLSPSVALKIGDSTHYRIDYVVIQAQPFSCSIVNDGMMRKVRLDDKIIPIKGIGPFGVAAGAKGATLVRLFEMDYSRMAFQGLTEGIDAWEPLLASWMQGVDGFQVRVEERTMEYQKHKFHHYRIVATRTGEMVKKLGPSQFEIVVDGDRFLPTTIKNVRKDNKGKSWQSQWAVVYRFHQNVTRADLNFG